MAEKKTAEAPRRRVRERRVVETGYGAAHRIEERVRTLAPDDEALPQAEDVPPDTALYSWRHWGDGDLEGLHRVPLRTGE